MVVFIVLLKHPQAGPRVAGEIKIEKTDSPYPAPSVTALVTGDVTVKIGQTALDSIPKTIEGGEIMVDVIEKDIIGTHSGMMLLQVECP
ncbi:hypothetical protein [Dryocola sp. BD586]|uniref:hypothetical protein n=1 Tax=Dryocola sp. BD586 TaxID=3133271 RepID=UPI003F502E58